MKKLALFFLFVVLFAPQAFAQQTAPATTAAPDAPANMTPDPKAMDSAKQLVQMLDLPNMFKSLFSIIGTKIMPMIMRDNPNQNTRIQQIVIDSMSRTFNSHMSELLQNYAVVYASVFSNDELQQIIAFYQLPVGQKMLKSLPQMMEKNMAVNQNVMISIFKESQDNLKQDLKKNQMKVPKEMGI